MFPKPGLFQRTKNMSSSGLYSLFLLWWSLPCDVIRVLFVCSPTPPPPPPAGFAVFSVLSTVNLLYLSPSPFIPHSSTPIKCCWHSPSASYDAEVLKTIWSCCNYWRGAGYIKYICEVLKPLVRYLNCLWGIVSVLHKQSAKSASYHLLFN